MYYVVLRYNQKTELTTVSRIFKQQKRAGIYAYNKNRLVAEHIVYHVVELDILSVLKKQGRI